MSSAVLEQSAEVDPRIQARRDEVERHARRRRHRRLIAAGAVAAVLALAWGLTHSPLLDVDGVEVSETEHLPAAQLVDASGVRAGEHLVDVDPGEVRARLLALPWVADAHVGLDWWSGTVRIGVTERVPVAAVATADARWVTADASGRAIAVLPPGGPGLIAVENVAPVEPGEQFGAGIDVPLQVIAGLPPGLRTRVFSVVAGTDGTVQLKVVPSGVVDLCQPDRLAEKLGAVATWFAHVDDTNLATLSVCVPDSPVATRHVGP